MIDIHTHLYWESYDKDRDDVVLRARMAGVEKMFVIGCTVEESRQSVELAEKYEELFASVGIHPHFFNERGDDDKQITEEIEALRELAKNKKVIAIGECGLDYYAHPARIATQNVADEDVSKNISDEQKILQKEGFLAQIELARELNPRLLFIVVHRSVRKMLMKICFLFYKRRAIHYQLFFTAIWAIPR